MHFYRTEDEDKRNVWKTRRLELKEPSDPQLRYANLNAELVSWIESFNRKRIEVIYVLGKNNQQ